jgi:hypothetical protein
MRLPSGTLAVLRRQRDSCLTQGKRTWSLQAPEEWRPRLADVCFTTISWSFYYAAGIVFLGTPDLGTCSVR